MIAPFEVSSSHSESQLLEDIHIQVQSGADRGHEEESKDDIHETYSNQTSFRQHHNQIGQDDYPSRDETQLTLNQTMGSSDQLGNRTASLINVSNMSPEYQIPMNDTNYKYEAIDDYNFNKITKETNQTHDAICTKINEEQIDSKSITLLDSVSHDRSEVNPEDNTVEEDSIQSSDLNNESVLSANVVAQIMKQQGTNQGNKIIRSEQSDSEEVEDSQSY